MLMISDAVLRSVLITNFKMKQNDQYFKELLRSRGLKATSGRIDLLMNLQGHKGAMPYSGIQKKLKSIDRVTLYRTIDSLINQGIIHQAYKENNDTYYALCGSGCSTHQHNHEHIHLKCIVCEAVTCHELHNKIEIPLTNFDIHKVSINVEGICEGCKTKSNT